MTTLPAPLVDPGGVRAISARWVVTADLVLQTATHLGGEVDAASMLLLRDGRDGGPLLPGTSITGALRSHLVDRLCGYRAAETDERIAQLFGGRLGDDEGTQSPLIVFDSLGVLPDGRQVEIRDGVQIDAARGTADEHKKYDFEVIPAGTRFPIRFDLLAPAAETESQLVSLLGATLSGLSGDIAVGARRSRGLGAARAQSWRAVRYDLTTADGWLTWLLADDGGAPQAESASDLATALRGAWPQLALHAVADRRRRDLITVELASRGPLLIRSAPAEPSTPDTVHLRSAGRSVVPGTSLTGVLRARATRIARIARLEHDDAERWVDAVFGPRLDGIPDRDEIDACASRIRISESFVEGGVRRRPSRIRIDRFTRGVVPGALFDEEVLHGGQIQVEIELRESRPGELGLVLLVLKDLLSGELPIGGSSAIGRGAVWGRAVLHTQAGRVLKIDPDRSADPFVDGEIEKLWSAPAIGGPS